ncbi:MAG TPA: glycosyltransferase family 39 protein [Terriglobales bacterium]|nr:glycosyltransferase family 39 protein [Terriglobales bacterium]
MLAVLAISAFSFALHMIFNNRYGYFRDEFDYIICGRHLAWGYVDQPPLVPVLSRMFIGVFGESLRAVRLMPVLAVSATIIVSGLIARELGGKRFAVILTALSVLIAPIYLSNASLLTSNCLEPLLWMGCAYFALLAVQRNPRYWLWFGVVAGIGMQEKYSIAVFGFGIVVGLLLTAQRRVFLDKWIWIGGSAAFLIFLPNLLWNVAHDWPFVQLMHNIKADGRDVVLSPWDYFSQQMLLVHPVNAIFWVTGVIALLVAARFRPYRFLGFAYLVAFTTFVVLKGKNYYLGPIYPVYLAAGAIVIDSAIDRLRQGWRWLKPALAIIVLAAGAYFAPLVVPVLPVDSFLDYMTKLPIKVPRTERSHARAALPQHYADQYGWNEVVTGVAGAWNRIPEADRADCGIFAQDYGQAGAIDFLGRKSGLPQSLSGHQTWWLWGPRQYSGNCMIVLDDDQETLQKIWNNVEYVGRTPDNPYALERNLTIFICRGFKQGTLTELWPKLKKWR